MYATDDDMRNDMSERGYSLVETAEGELSTYEHYFGGGLHVIARIPKDASGSIAFYRYWDTEP